jgi:membrane carboxypeptidase/penicillin-binding protein PbpC
MPAVRAHLLVDAVPCQAALAAIPPELAPNLQGFKLQGTFKSELSIDIDPDALDKMELSSKIGIDACNVLQAPSGVAGDKLRATFDHAVEVEPGSWLAFSVGPENPEWIPYAEISPHLINSIMTTEDSTFLQHKGFIGREFKSALRTNLEHGAFRLGASSITMQLVKNVLLSREKTLSRKLQELFLTWYVEHNLSKTRILEIYFNVIEYGPGIYGIGRAAKHYFGKLPRELSPREASFFSSILPSPKRRYVHYCKGPELDQKWEQYLNRILRRMHERGRLTDEEFDKAIASPLRFDMKESLPSEKCLEMVRRLSVPQAPGGLITIPLGRALEAAPPEATPETDAPGTPAPLPTEVPEP